MMATTETTARLTNPDTVTAQAAVEPTASDESLASDLRQVYAALFRSYADEMLKPNDEFDPTARWDGTEWAERISEAPVRLLSWIDVTALIEHHPERVLALWARVKREAREELAGGHRAALALKPGTDPWERAQFLAIRDSFIDEWTPRGGMERALIDQMAMAHSQYLGWMQRLDAERESRALWPENAGYRKGREEPPRVTSTEAVAEAAAMAERFQRVFVRAIRTLRDLRRYAPSVVVQSAGQVNVGAVQTNQISRHSDESAVSPSAESDATLARSGG
jgi:hypothetical protein